MKRKYNTPEADIEFFNISSSVFTTSHSEGEIVTTPGAGWEEEDGI